MELSIIVPAYNEEKRMESFLNKLLIHLNNWEDTEVVLVNDGSTDKTEEIMSSIAASRKKVNIVSYEKNQGKGEAVRRGVKSAKGNYVIFIDADGSISPDQIPKMLENLRKYDIVVGNRASKLSKIKQSKLRKFTGVMFNMYVRFLFRLKIKDNLCGFKGFKREIALELFENLIDKRWLFDVEIFYKIKKRKYSLYQQPLEWEHKKDSRIKWYDPFKMLFQLIALRLKLIDYK